MKRLNKYTRSFTLCLLLVVLFPVTQFAQTVDEPVISGTFRNMSFEDFVQSLEAKYPLHFYFKQEWVAKLKVNLDVDSLSLSSVMESVLLPTLMDFDYEAPGKVYILPDKKFAKQLPEFYYPSRVNESVDIRAEEKVQAEQRYLNGRQPDMIQTIIVGSRDKAKRGKLAIVTGRLFDAESNEPLIGATVYVPALKRGAATDVNGKLSLSIKPGFYAAEFQCVGTQGVKGNLDVRSDGNFQLALKKQVQAIDEIVIQGDENQKRGARPGMESVSVKTIKELPTLMGEKDVLKVAQLLPGIVSVGEGSAGINVRGGNADQNLFYVNEMPVYNSSHLFGFFSSVNSGIIDNFTIYKGQIPAQYGGRLSSVFNVETRRGNKNKFFTQGGVSPISANAEIEAPILKDKISMMLSARSSYSDWILKRLKDPDLRNSSASFYDFAAALDFDINANNRVAVFAYNSSDDFDLNGYSDYTYGNTGASVNFTHRFNLRLKSGLSLIASGYNFDTTSKQDESSAYTHGYDLGHYELRASANWTPNENHNVQFGTSQILYQLDRGKIEPYGSESLKSELDLGEEKGLESAFFIDDNLKLSSSINLYAGLRYSMFSKLGPAKVRSYYANAEVKDENVSGETDYSSGENVVSYHFPEVRAGADFKIDDYSSLKLSFTQMTQYLFMLSNTISIAPNDQWKLVDSHIKPPRATQYSLGLFRSLPRLGLNASAELYYKQSKNIVEYKDGVDFLSTPYAETLLLQGEQDAYGAEMMLSREAGRLNGWLSYTYSRSFMTVDGGNGWDEINQGERYPSNFDKPHVMNLVLNYKVNRRFSLSSNLVYNTGRPVTIPEGVYYINNQPFIDYSDRNAYRIPDYFRVDFSLKMEGNLKRNKPLHSYWMLSVYNLTGRSNANSIFFLSEDGYLHGYKYSVIGQPIVTISWNWKLGNYANQ